MIASLPHFEVPAGDKHTTANLDLLTRAIERDPATPANYVLRGEEWLLCGAYDRAAADFERAIVLAQHDLEHSAWGYVLQSLIDRAEVGLRACDGYRHAID